MRTTLNIDDDVFVAAKSLAASSGRSLGSVVSELMRKGLAPSPIGRGDGLPAFTVSANAQIVTPEMVREALDEDW
jgi:hypothetical protein